VEPQKDAHSSGSPRKVDPFWAEQIAAARREGNRIGTASLEREPIPPAKLSRAKLAWVLGWPVLFIGAFVASALVHEDPVGPAPLVGFGDVSTAEWALFLLGFWALVIWILGCLILLIGAALRSRSEGRPASPSRLRMEGTGWVENEEGGEPPK
jgi:hypothetical protein